MPILNKPSLLTSTVASKGTTSPEDGYLFNESGLPYDVQYLGKLSITASADAPSIVAADPKRLEYGSVALSSIQQQVKSSGLTSAVSGIALLTAPGTVTFSIQEGGGLSSLHLFVKTTNGATLSGSVPLGPII